MTRTKIGDRIRINFYLDSQVFEALKKIAALKNSTYSEMIRRACYELVVREGMQAIESQKIISGMKP